MKRLFFAIAILPWLLIACNTFTFEEPQPVANAALKSIPDNLVGRYFNYDNRSDLLITPQVILTSYPSLDTIPVAQLARGESIKGDTLYSDHFILPYKITRINDSLFTGYRYVDTVFNMADSKQVLKSEGFDFFLNFKRDDDQWQVTRLAFRGDVINIANIETENEVKMMEKITGARRGEDKELLVNPSNEQLKKFVDQNGFTKGENYLKIDSVANPLLQ